MKKTIYILIGLISLICLYQFCSDANNSLRQRGEGWKQFGIKGNVKKITEVRYRAIEKFGKVQKGEIIGSSYETFDDFGNIVEEKWLGENGRWDRFMKCKYDEYNKILEDVYYDSAGKQEGKRIYEYNGSGFLTGEKFYGENGSLSEKTVFQPNRKGENIETKMFEPNGTLRVRYTYKRDESGKLSETQNYWGDTLNYIIKFEYDSKGNITQTTDFDSNGQVASKTSQKYDNNNNLIEKITYNKSDDILKTETYKYEFDKTGNWIKSIHFENGNPLNITQRVIEYNQYNT